MPWDCNGTPSGPDIFTEFPWDVHVTVMGSARLQGAITERSWLHGTAIGLPSSAILVHDTADTAAGCLGTLMA